MGYMDSGRWVIGDSTPDTKSFVRKPSTARPGLSFELLFAGDTGCAVVSQPVRQSRQQAMP